MTVERFPVEAGHIMIFARAIGDENPAQGVDLAKRFEGRARPPGGKVPPAPS